MDDIGLLALWFFSFHMRPYAMHSDLHLFALECAIVMADLFE